MRERKLGSTSLLVSELSLGTWGLSGDGYGPVDERVQDQVIDRARHSGVTLFETADCYAGGAMEKRLGERLKDAPQAMIFTKIGNDGSGSPPSKRFDRAFLREAFERSRERIGRAAVDGVLLHNPSLKAVERGEATALLAELKAEGALRVWGVSAGSVAVAKAALERGAEVISLAFNAFHRSDVRALHDVIFERGAGLLAHSVLAYGVLTGKWPVDHYFPFGDHRAERWTTEDLRLRQSQLSALRPCLDETITSTRAVALRYVLSEAAVASAVLGPRNKMQLDQLLRDASEGPYFREHQLSALDHRLTAAGISP